VGADRIGRCDGAGRPGVAVTAEQRVLVRQARDQRSRVLILDEDETLGSPHCQFCFAAIEDRKPRKRFCSDSCRKRNGDTNTPHGRAARHARKRRAIQGRAAA
jgi:hypothetical protein